MNQVAKYRRPARPGAWLLAAMLTLSVAPAALAQQAGSAQANTAAQASPTPASPTPASPTPASPTPTNSAAPAASNTMPGTMRTPRTPGEASSLSQQISNEIYSPFCPGKTLEMCPSSGASEVRQQIQSLALEGADKQEIIDSVIAEIGEKYRITKPPPEDNYLLFGILVGAFILCVGIIYFVGRRVRGQGDGSGDEGGPGDDELSAEDRLYLEELRGEYLD